MHTNNREGLSYHIATDVKSQAAKYENAYGELLDSTEYFNYTQREVIVCLRNGASVKIPPKSQRGGIHIHNKHVVVRQTIQYSDNVKFRGRGHSDQYVSRISDVDVAVQEAIGKSVRVSHDHALTVGMNTLTIEYLIPEHWLNSNLGCVYVVECDAFLRSTTATRMAHPYSSEGTTFLNVVKDVEESRVNRFEYTVWINDPHFEFGARWINVNDRAFEVRIETNVDIPPGVWVTYQSKVPGSNIDYDESEHYSFEEASSKINLYTTKQDAETLGNSEKMASKQIRDRDLELQNEQLRWKTEILGKSKEMEEYKASVEIEQSEMRRELAYDKHQFEKDLMRRKSITDILKLGIMIGSTALNAYLLYLKLKEKGN